jgi:hypothetical protein
MDVRASQKEAKVNIGSSQASLHYMAYCCWVTSGEHHYARANHAICRIVKEASEKNRKLRTSFTIGPDGEPRDYDLSKRPSGDGSRRGYFYTYGGDDLLLEWASLTGDPEAVDAILVLGKYHEKPEVRRERRSYHSPEALYVALAFLQPENPEVYKMLKSRGVGTKRITQRNMTTDGNYKSAKDWHRYNVWLYGKNAMSIRGAGGLEFLHRILGFEIIEAAKVLKASKP